MLDSLDLIIFNIERLDFRYLRTLGIEIKRKKERRNIFWFKYKEITFKFCPTSNYLLIITKVKDLLNKRDIALSDRSIYQGIILPIIKEIINTSQKISIYVSRIDYAIDIRLEDVEMLDIYIYLLKQYRHKYKYMRKKQEYSTSLYLTNKTGQFTLNFYNKYEESKNKEDKNVLRLEIQVKPAKIKSERKKGINTIISTFWSKEAMNKYFFEILKDYVYTGKYYKRNRIKKILKDESTFSNIWIKKLRRFNLMASRYGIYGIINKRMYCRDTINSYIEKLSKLNINPISIPSNSNYEELESLYTLAVDKATKQYFK